MSMHHHHRKLQRTYNFPNSHLAIMNADSRGSSEPSGKPILWQMRVDSAARYPVSLGKIPQSRARILSIFGALKRHGRFWIRR